MTKHRFARIVRSAVLFATSIAVLAPAFAQSLRDYTKPNGYFPMPLAPYLPHTIPSPKLANSPRIETVMKDGKIMLSLDDAISLALENNLDLAIARYNLAIADTDILRTKAGADTRGVNTGVVQGTPGGGVGGIGAGASGGGAGGTASGAGGAGSGASGLVQSTLGAGAPISSYDPVLTGTLGIEHAVFPLSNTITSGVAEYDQNTATGNFTYQQSFHTGTTFSAAFNNNRIATNSLFDTLNPTLQGIARVSLRQHLLSGFGVGPNTRMIRIAKNNKEISDIAFRDQVIATVAQIENIYWDLVNDYEDVRVKERSLQLAEKTLSDNREQVRIGNLAPIEITRAESEVATRNQDVILAQTNLQLQQLLIKNAITRSLNDPILGAAEVIPTDTMQTSENEPVTPVQDLINDAMSHRPDLAEARIDMTNRAISRKAAANALLPQVDLVGYFGTSSLAGVQNPLFTVANGGPPPGTIAPTGFGDAFSNLTSGTGPDYYIGVNITIPIRNRVAQADQIRSELEYRQAEMRLQQLQNQVVIEVRNAQFTVQQNRARVDALRKARDLAQNTFEIEQKKFALGASTSFTVLQQQRDLAVAESALVAALSQYEKSRVELDRVTGLLLNRNHIELEDAVKGEVKHQPNVPEAAPRAELLGTPVKK